MNKLELDQDEVKKVPELKRVSKVLADVLGYSICPRCGADIDEVRCLECGWGC